MNLMNATKYTMQFKNLSILILLSCHFKNTYKYTIDPVLFLIAFEDSGCGSHQHLHCFSGNNRQPNDMMSICHKPTFFLGATFFFLL